MHTLETDASPGERVSVSSRTFPADRTAPRAAASWLRSLPTGLPESRLADAELCVDELVTNIVRHAFPEPDGAPRTVTVSVERADSGVEITVEDAGRPFDPTTAPLPALPRTLEEAVLGGRGLLLVRSTCARIRYERREGQNRVFLRFPLGSA